MGVWDLGSEIVGCPVNSLTFYDFPGEHWDHLRTSNPIESVFAVVRHRTVRTQGALSQTTAQRRVFKLDQGAAKKGRRLQNAPPLSWVIQGVVFSDGAPENDHANRAA